MQIRMKKFSQGFTLIELMVVVTLIGILIAAGIIAFTNAQMSARDSKRKADINAISDAMEQYFQTNKAYPLSPYPAAIGGLFPSGSIPKDPNGSSYTITSISTKFCACVKLDRPGKGNADDLGALGVCTFNNTTASDYFCAAQRQ